MFGLEDPYLIIVNVGLIVLCTLVAGLMSGLNLAFFSLDLTHVSTLAMGTNETQARRAKRILLVLQHPHWLLVTLLLMNAIAGESLPLALDELAGPAVAIPVSVVLILVFGEIIPQSVFVSNAIPVCAFFSYLVYGVMIITAPISLVVGLMLDVLVGHREAMFYRRRELREFLSLQTQALDGVDGAHPDWTDSDDDAEVGGKLAPKEVKLMMGALSLSETAVKHVVRTTIEETICVSLEDRVTKELVERVFLSGKSRIPVYSGTRDNCTHYFLSKTLILQTYKQEEEAPFVKDLALIPAEYIAEDHLMGEAYQLLTANPVHLLFVVEAGSLKVTGILTSSDVFESIHSARFTDEYDLGNTSPMQMLIKSCWTDKNREKRGSGRMSRGPIPRVNSYSNVNNNSIIGGAARIGVIQGTRPSLDGRPRPQYERPDAKLIAGRNEAEGPSYGTTL